jgi:methylated-DNA-[protein]-cysteine S-methyltransferase
VVEGEKDGVIESPLGGPERMMRYCEISTPVGRLLLAGDEEGLRRIAFQSELHSTEVAERWQRTEEPFQEAIAQLEAYFAGRLRRFDLALAPEGTPFQREVWSALTVIPYGETVSYSELARRLGRPAASRAVGAANGRNPIPIIIPCHRVIGADGSLTGFGGGGGPRDQAPPAESRGRVSTGCHPEPFAVAQDRLREGSLASSRRFLGPAALGMTRELGRRMLSRLLAVLLLSIGAGAAAAEPVRSWKCASELRSNVASGDLTPHQPLKSTS